MALFKRLVVVVASAIMGEIIDTLQYCCKIFIVILIPGILKSTRSNIAL